MAACVKCVRVRQVYPAAGKWTAFGIPHPLPLARVERRPLREVEPGDRVEVTISRNQIVRCVQR